MQQILLRFGERMRKLREDRNLTQEDFAASIGLHRTAISLLERGHRVPSLQTLLMISIGFRITLSNLLYGVDEKLLAKWKDIPIEVPRKKKPKIF